VGDPDVAEKTAEEKLAGERAARQGPGTMGVAPSASSGSEESLRKWISLLERLLVRFHRSHGANLPPSSPHILARVRLDHATYLLLRISEGAEASLSSRQREIVTLAAEGLSNRAIAERLGLCRSTVSWHLQEAFDKLNVHSRAELARRCMFLG
jgi:DNA-binding NarL/FixJ family response regulator